MVLGTSHQVPLAVTHAPADAEPLDLRVRPPRRQDPPMSIKLFPHGGVEKFTRPVVHR
ncbi:hypothetical protein [Micromonospora sp. NPDC047730]|uniref:hypothetical protein n=1 Tax=Micromonospora sp. NPDC047730 TaxID=3364253 RepID=UPI00371AFB6B